MKLEQHDILWHTTHVSGLKDQSRFNLNAFLIISKKQIKKEIICGLDHLIFLRGNSDYLLKCSV